MSRLKIIVGTTLEQNKYKLGVTFHIGSLFDNYSNLGIRNLLVCYWG